MRKYQIVSVLIALCFVMGCAGFGQQKIDTPEKKYLTVRAELNLLIETYLQVQDQVSDEDHARVKMALESADIALDTWETYLDNDNYDFSANVQAWMKAKSAVLQILKDL
jgi:hypothetical protein